LFAKPLVSESIVTAEDFIRMQRNHQFVNKFTEVIASAMRCNHDVNFTPPSLKVRAAGYYMTNYVTKSQTDRGQLVLAAAFLKKAQPLSFSVSICRKLNILSCRNLESNIEPLKYDINAYLIRETKIFI
jgi:hypothetical protein